MDQVPIHIYVTPRIPYHSPVLGSPGGLRRWVTSRKTRLALEKHIRQEVQPASQRKQRGAAVVCL